MVVLESKMLESVLKLTIGLVAVLLINIVGNMYFFRLDLTEENRFSISEPTKLLLKNLEDDVYVEVYLEGDLPAAFQRLRNSIEETLEEFRIYSNNRLHYSFIDPMVGESPRAQNEYMLSIAQKGIQPTDVTFTENGRRIQKRILPGAVVSYGAREKGVLLFKGNLTAPSEVRLNQSVEGIEYELANAINAMTKSGPETVGISTGHGEISGESILGFKSALEENYIVRDVTMNFESLRAIDIVVIPKPEEMFNESEQLALDQYIMYGGKVIFLLDALIASMDSSSISIPYELGLDDMLFRYGIRINKDLVLDMLSAQAPIVIGNFGEAPQIQLLPWPFYPLINVYGDHPIVRNLDAVKFAFGSSLDTVSAPGSKRTALMYSSSNSRSMAAPIIIDLNELKKPLNPKDFTDQHIPMGYLLEGIFTSAFKNRPLPGDVETIMDESVPTKLVVIGDGDIVRNEFDPQNGRPLPLGFDYYTKLTYANKDFLMNTIAYMLQDDGLILSRNKEVVLRPLNKQKIAKERFKWQLINMLLPIVFLLLFGWLWHILRKRKYTGF